MHRSRPAGFTLVEMLVVIGIIAILVAILYPVFSSARIKAKQARCASNLHQLVVALKQYAEDYRAYPPWPSFDSVAGRFTGGFSALYPDYITDAGLLICPDDTKAVTREKQAKDMAYCSYNADIDFGAFVAAPGNFLDTQTLPDSTTLQYLKNRLYNYFGYNDTGLDPFFWADPAVNPSEPNRCFLGPEFGDALPTWLSAKGLYWRHYPRLMNRYAPDNTIVTHCVKHRRHYSLSDRRKWKDVLVHLGGESQTVEVSSLDALTDDVAGWVHQRY